MGGGELVSSGSEPGGISSMLTVIGRTPERAEKAVNVKSGT